MSHWYWILFFNLTIFFSLGSVEPPSEEAYEEETPIPKISKKEKKKETHYDFYEPSDKKHKELLNQYLNVIESRKIYLEPHWIQLLRYKKNILFGFDSEIVTDSYFLSERGSANPRKEILATVRGLFYMDLNQVDQSPQCLFPERYRWLREILKMDGKEMSISCTRYVAWKQGINLSKAKLVFASYYLQSPASMFGHTFLKLNQILTPTSDLLDYGVGYAADPGDIDPIRYVVGGVFGGYTGKFSIFPYYIKVNEYNDLENRDLWEYELTLDPLEKEILLGHLWELGRAEFDYFFQKENCAFQILRLMDVVKEDLHPSTLRPTFTPLDLLKNLKERGLIGSQTPEYRPSLYQKIIHQIDALEEMDQALYWENLSRLNAGRALKVDQQTDPRLISVLIDSYQYRFPNQLSQKNDYLELLKLQSRNSIPEDNTRTIRSTSPPDVAHGSYRLSAGYGNSSLGNFAEMEARLAYHDILNVDLGLPKNSEIQFFNFKFRKYENRNPELTSMNLIKLTSLSPYNSLSRKASYMIDFGSQTVTFDQSENRKAVGNLDLLYGTSFAREFTKSVNLGVLSLLAGVKTQTNHDFRYGMRYGPQAMIHYLYDFGNWKIQWFYSYSYLAMSKNENFFQNTLRLRYALNSNHEIRMEYTAYPMYSETLLSYHFLF